MVPPPSSDGAYEVPAPATKAEIFRRVLILALGAMGLALLGRRLLSPAQFHHLWPILRLGLVGTGLGAALLRWRREPRERWVWGWLGIALLAWSVEDLAYFAASSPGHDMPEGWVGALVFLGVFLAIPLALLRWPLRAEAREGHGGRDALDALLFSYAALCFAWLMGMKVWAKEIPTFDMVGSLRAFSLFVWTFILGLCVRQGARDPARWRGPLAWIAVYYALATLLNATLMGLSLGTSLGLPGDVGLLLKLGALACFAGAAWWPVPAEGEEGVGTETLSQLLPYIPALLALLAVTWVLLRHPERVGAELLAWGLPLMVLLLWRQYLALRDLRRLSQELETKVVRRTRALEEAQRLALSTERMNTVASLGAGLAHDLNNLIGVTKNYAELAEMGQEEGKPVDPRDLRRIREAATRAGELTTQLMAFGRQQGTPPTTVCLRDHLREKLSLFSMVARPPAQLILEPGEDPLPVLLSASQLDQLIVNLLSNACDAMPKGGRIWVRALREHLEDGRPAARLEVEDQGSGIDPEKLAYIFEPFFTTKEPGRGTGLGLASVRALVEGWEGSLGVESQVGRGTRIWILLPLAEGGHPQD